METDTLHLARRITENKIAEYEAEKLAAVDRLNRMAAKIGEMQREADKMNVAIIFLNGKIQACKELIGEDVGSNGNYASESPLKTSDYKVE